MGEEPSDRFEACGEGDGGELVSRAPGSLGRLISILHRYWYIHMDRELAELQLGAGQIPILMTLYRADGVTQNDIVRHLRTDKGATARTIRRLVDEGYVTREPHPDDGRAYVIRLTPKAVAIKEHLRTLLRGWTAQLVDGFAAPERELLTSMLERMVANAELCVRPSAPTGERGRA